MNYEDPPPESHGTEERWQALQDELAIFLTSADGHAVRDHLRAALAPVSLMFDQLFSPASFLGDIFLASNPNRQESERIEACRRLACNHFSKGRLFHPARWVMLEPAFLAWRQDRLWRQAWEDLAIPRLLQAIDENSSVTTWGLGTFYDAVRRRTRANIERDLLGRTADSGDPIAKLPQYPLPPSPGEILEWADVRMDLLRAVGQLAPKEREAVTAFICDTPDDVIAERDGVKAVTVRKRRSRAFGKLREIVDADVTK